MEEIVLSKLKTYNHPAKTKNLSILLGIDKNELTIILNKLLKERKVTYTFQINKYGLRIFGWIINPYLDLHIGLFHTRKELIYA